VASAIFLEALGELAESLAPVGEGEDAAQTRGGSERRRASH
jgi:hypothetical protein